MKIETFFGNKLGICTKEELDNLTVEQMEGVDTAFFCEYEAKIANRSFQYGDTVLAPKLTCKNKDLSQVSLCINSCFYALHYVFKGDVLGAWCKKGQIEGMDFDVDAGKISLMKDEDCIIAITALPQASLYGFQRTAFFGFVAGDQHWVCEKGNTHNLPKDKSVNVHEYYDVIEKEGYVECTVDFFQKGVGETQTCGSGAFCVGMHLFKIYGKEVVVKNKNGYQYFVNENTISIEI